jgi:exosortase/archaeosortase family protein
MAEAVRGRKHGARMIAFQGATTREIVAGTECGITGQDQARTISGFGGLALRWASVGGSFPALILYAFLMDARRIGAWAAQANCPTLAESLGKIDFLTLAEWIFILALVAKSDFSAIRLGRFERLVATILTLYAALFIDPLSHVHIVPCVWLAGRMAIAPRLRPLCACLLLVSLQRLPNNIFPGGLHAASIWIDAAAAHSLLLTAGYANEIHGALLRLVGSSHAIEIHDGCDTLAELPLVVSAFLIFTLSRNMRLDRRFIFHLAATALLLFVANWLRLCAMARSYDDYLFWHDGTGASIVAMTYALIPFLMNDKLAKSQTAARRADCVALNLQPN